ncbi:hypothetical protein QJS10_CPA16g01138 [Acorus calamus]|uniref:BZIP domain-containing protein n=1 Tax=Acorus calamus TaxID=4465 RepID=A0AAV9D2C9_ACOCL|nr:hypothetical protein QJS10_CPA16g01138 [Acorus calamus]
MERMDDGDVEFSDQILLSNPETSNEYDDTFFEEFLKNTHTCTHTHTCNPPGPDSTHTHTCYHTHTQVFTSGDEKEQSPKPRKPLGNREAVRKYREKKKAHAAYLEEEVKKLRVMNQQLLKRLQGQSALEAEVLRLRSLLMDIRGKIDAEVGVFPFQRPCADASFGEGDCSLQTIDLRNGCRCEKDAPCLRPRIGGNAEVVGWEGRHGAEIVECQSGLNMDVNHGLSVGGGEAQLDCLMSNNVDTVGCLASSASKA